MEEWGRAEGGAGILPSGGGVAGVTGLSEPGDNGGRGGRELSGRFIDSPRSCDACRGRGRFEGVPEVSLVPRSTPG